MERANLMAIGVACLIGASAAMATEPSANPNSSTSSTMARDKAGFSAMDTDRDGYLSKSEAQQAGIGNYTVADKNGDGRLDSNEVASAMSSGHSSQGSSSSMSKPMQPSDSTSTTHP
jgi:Ca2+-binding EF-hand superfamily protein